MRVNRRVTSLYRFLRKEKEMQSEEILTRPSPLLFLFFPFFLSTTVEEIPPSSTFFDIIRIS